MRKLLFVGGALLSLAALAVDFPAAEEGVITLDVASGSVTYDKALGSATMLVKTGAGEAVLTVETSAFTGAVEVREGTLRITHGKALGVNTPISVTGEAATFFLNANDTYTGKGEQSADWFWGHNLTIRGAGAGGQGAFRYQAQTWKMYDRGIDTLTLTGDATICLGSRIGFAKSITLNGHKLTRKADGSGDTWMVSSLGSIDKGEIDNDLGTVTFQSGAPQIGDVANSRLVVNNGQTVTFWAFQTLALPFVLNSATLRADNGTGATLAGSVTVNKNTTVQCQANTALRITGPIEINSAADHVTSLSKIGAGKFYLDGPMTLHTNGKSAWDMHINNSDMGWIICSSNVNREIGAYVGNGGMGAKLWMAAGTLRCMGMTRIGNGSARSAVWQTGGVYMNNPGDEGRIGESGGGYGAWTMDGGEARFSNSVFVAEHPNSQGIVRQAGGLFEVTRTGALRLGNRGRGELYVFGGTNDSSRCSNLEMSYFGGSSTLVVSGKDAVLTAPNLITGCNTNDSTRCVVSLKDGGTLIARRFYRTGGKAYVSADNATMMPTVWGGWGNKDREWEGFADGAFTKFVILSGGLTIDTSLCYSEDRTRMGNSWSPISYGAPSGKRIASISLPTDDGFKSAKYFGPAMVTIEGNGWGASAFADFDYTTEKIKGVIVTSGGCDYDGDTKVTLCSPDGKTWYDCAYTLEDNAPGGALSKRGEQELILCGAQTYTGGTIVEQGLLTINDNAAFPANSALTVKRGARFNANGCTFSVSSLSGEGVVRYCQNVTVQDIHVKLDDLFSDDHTPLTIENHVLNLGAGAKLVVDDPENFEKYRNRKAAPVLKSPAINGSLTFEGPKDGPQYALRLSKDRTTFLFGPLHGLAVIVR